MGIRTVLLLIPVIVCVIFASCNVKSVNSEVLPPNILSEDQLAEVLADYALAESAANLNIKNVGLPTMDTVYAFDPLKFRGIRAAQYDSSLHYYSLHPKLYKSVYEKTLTKLTEIESRSSAPKIDSASKKQNAQPVPGTGKK